ncbi:PH domain-containing protein [Virgibacillus sp. W0430]|uniref:PH domain-containing protein n=1 Tax=Virgibacillus sp. W0430 TaxID=3391580 RepID=UPI003F46D212
MMSKAERLHPIAIIFNFILFFRHTVFMFIAGYLALKEHFSIYIVLIASAVILLFIIGSVLSWWRFTYRVESDEIRIEYGVFIRKKRYISKNRIQSIDLTANVLHRIFKLVKVQIETAGSGEGAEASLSAVRLREGERIRSALKSYNSTDQAAEEAIKQDHPSKKITFKRLFIAGTTSGSVGVILAIAAFGSQELDAFIPETLFEDTVSWVIGLSIVFIVALIVCVLLLLWLLGIAGTIIKYGNFTVTKSANELFITRGLLEKKQLTIPLKRIQAVGIKQNLIRQPFGFVTLFAVVAGGSVDKGEDFPILFPLMRESEVEGFLQTYLPSYANLSTSLIPLPKRALKFYLLRAAILPIILIAGVAYFIPTLIWIPIVVFIFSLILGYLRYKNAGHVIESERATIQVRLISKVKMILFHRRIQAFEEEQHKIQKIQRLASTTISIIGSQGAGTHYTLKDMDEKDSAKLASWYSYRP